MRHVKQLAILNVYYPSSDADMDCYTQCVHDLEETLNLFDGESTALVIAGDLNAHLGSLAGLKGHGPPNERGLVLKEFIDRNNLLWHPILNSSLVLPILITQVQDSLL